MSETITGKMSQCTSRIFTDNLQTMVEFGIITQKNKELLTRVLDDFKYGKKKLQLDSLDIYFRYDKEMFDDAFLKAVGNPQKYHI